MQIEENMKFGSQWQDNPNNRVCRCLKARERGDVLSREEQRVVKRT
jgi:hypothetical protein